ncbi:hypothetical protein U27_05783 [Candidatus Vecturithrix granuli]|uniref:Uncharacterized protein n=1 Tax=Vecturithrix granuli TaxID=1499967 RepID=A0A081C2K3_VECG1|nr:hypothetical protein U27_05783 [Candidatus Vecturithrix granuli]
MKHSFWLIVLLFVVCAFIMSDVAEVMAEAGIPQTLRQQMLKQPSFTAWLVRWQASNPGLTLDAFQCIEAPQLSNFPVAEEGTLGVKEKEKMYSPDRAHYLYFPDPGGEPDQEVWLYNRKGDRTLERLGCIGSSSWYDGGFWLDNEHFIILSGFQNIREECWVMVEYWDFLNDQRFLYQAVLKCRAIQFSSE